MGQWQGFLTVKRTAAGRVLMATDLQRKQKWPQIAFVALLAFEILRAVVADKCLALAVIQIFEKNFYKQSNKSLFDCFETKRNTVC
jgi:hypothetical protein